mmetsp:Transcript_10079/g.7562  ORF Transcript_10079/g.7562 Transcript_10079/m.7562 type:complete len:81 (+) Transcript_10079:539-781(+)|eukprot:CAMPEP_0202964668 /NCGR_PEP_ID=MMETSP1396-20130829/8748_1 /ASSEMBLY_ACC=CAM_ASM_000872 /TAXON_ID= /ORGANISM="Pseudokeronopsis sp., Strain Brazil" /LENGTH=80 /DNA_ID=CAMNT_0049686931 /DNA_START=538 /DNA_END=780 /DNA_ORIENTATION=+
MKLDESSHDSSKPKDANGLANIIEELQTQVPKPQIWTLENENFILKQKLEEALEKNQKHERELRNINFKLKLLVKDIPES